MTPYQRRLILFLSVATFFEGYDFFGAEPDPAGSARRVRALAQRRRLAGGGDQLRHDDRRVPGAQGRRLGPAAGADRDHRRLHLCSLATAAAPDVYAFAAAQLAARVFLIGEWAIAMVFAAEEFPAERRGLVIGVIQACSSLGSVVCAGVVPLLVRYRARLAAGLPRRRGAADHHRLRAARPARDRSASSAAGGVRPPPSSTCCARRTAARILQMALIWGVTYVATQNANHLLEGVRHARARLHRRAGRGCRCPSPRWSSMPLVFLSGKLLDASAGGAARW